MPGRSTLLPRTLGSGGGGVEGLKGSDSHLECLLRFAFAQHGSQGDLLPRREGVWFWAPSSSAVVRNNFQTHSLIRGLNPHPTPVIASCGMTRIPELSLGGAQLRRSLGKLPAPPWCVCCPVTWAPTHSKFLVSSPYTSPE